jgi:hypothetical protein
MENVEKFKVISKDHHEYDIQVTKREEGTVYELRYSNMNLWTAPGEKVLTITDTGNFMEVKPKLKKIAEYDKFAEFLILSNFIKSYDKILISDLTIVSETLIGNI